ncbi:hypothetical protein SAMN04489761_2019 [Tenacibaculum sp. MAR_2009_124]|uniref:hypothetical protein n=1 Tax=Tenacibaculum sp. MAR_2009_124 TaxID=1250059 RepID=UPI00089885B1|nr:hypothetical protein [Tenacibaculum sp. MAR_2009_124]SEB87391.1 hypothetical protein SAMN04489761_2019 [Tenacibaculum sp. MAR_2009_124]
MEKVIEKTAKQIKERLEFWFFNYFNKNKIDFNGSELFTLFELLKMELQIELKSQLNLEHNEILVLILKISETEYIVNSTKRFIRINSNKIESINYTEFDWHKGYKSFVVNKEKKIVTKHDGYLSEFGLRKRNGEIIYWNIPTGFAGYGFWNVTKKCELIGRKFKQVD